MKKIQIRNKILDFSTPVVMGILNITKDSFYDGGRYLSDKNILQKVKQMLSDGASIIDIGAQSSRPGSTPIAAALEIERLVETITLLKSHFQDIIISVDTYRAKTAEICVHKGADIINDISAGELDKNMINTIAALQIPYIMMHMKGNPSKMQENPIYENVTEDIFCFLEQKINLAQQKGIKNIIIDPGFGFGKSLAHNYQLLADLQKFKTLDLPILVGVSRKSMIYNLLNNSPENALNGTSIVHTIALLHGANILRTHDVKEAMECIRIVNFAKTYTNYV